MSLNDNIKTLQHMLNNDEVTGPAATTIETVLGSLREIEAGRTRVRLPKVGSAIPESIKKFLDQIKPPTQESIDAVEGIFQGIKEQHANLERAMELVKEMQEQPDADPALEFVLKTLEGAKRGGGIDLIEMCNRGKHLTDDRTFTHLELAQQGFEFMSKADVVDKLVRLQAERQEVRDIIPQSLQQIAQRLRSRSGPTVSPMEVIEAIEALPESLRKHRDLLGRGLLRPQVTYDPVVTEVKQYIENVQAARGYLIQADMPDQLEEVEDYLLAHLRWLMTPQHDFKPVMELKHMAETLREWIGHESLSSTVKFDMGNMVEALDKVIARHVAEELPVKVEGHDDPFKMGRLGWAMKVLNKTISAHPFDISQKDLNEVYIWMGSIVVNTRGYDNLGKEEYALVPLPGNLPGIAIDAVRHYLIEYGEGRHTAEDLREAACRGGSPGLCYMPEWFAQTYGHIGKGGFASLLFHTMVSVAAETIPKKIYVSSEERKALEAALKAGQTTAWVDFVKNAEKRDAK